MFVRHVIEHQITRRQASKLTQALTLTACSREISGSNLGRNMDCYEVLLSASRLRAREYLQLGHDRFLPRHSKTITITYHSTTYSQSY
jgi:hypothetical protein